MKTIITMFITIFGIILIHGNYLFTNNNNNNIGIFLYDIKYNIEEHQKALQYAKNNLELEKSYKVQYNIEKFKSILIGVWDCFPQSWYEFRKDGSLKIWYNANWERQYNNPNPPKNKIIIKHGSWYIRNNKLVFKIDGLKNEFDYTIKEYGMSYNKFVRLNKYALSIETKEKIYLGSNSLSRSFD